MLYGDNFTYCDYYMTEHPKAQHTVCSCTLSVHIQLCWVRTALKLNSHLGLCNQYMQMIKHNYATISLKQLLVLVRNVDKVN